MHKNLPKKGKVTATFILMLLVTTLIASLLPKATATPSPVKIDSINPTSGPVGTTVRVIGEIDTTNGSYKILFDGKKVKNGTVVGTAVNDTFRVPLSVKGNHNVTLYDVTNDNQSLPEAFNVTTSYYVSAEPARIQEGNNTNLTVGVNEAEANAVYTFTINVTDPQKPAPRNYTATLTITTNATGSGSNSTLYYENFSAGANTNYVGTYAIAVIAINETLTTGNFTVGLTDKLEYERGETVNIQGSGYKVDENVTVDIKISGISISGYPKNVTAGLDDVIIDSWEIPANATPGTYTVTLTNATTPGTVKTPADAQNFTVLGAVCLIQAWNRGRPPEPLANVTIVASEATMPGVFVETTNETGWVEFRLDFGNYTFEAQWNLITSMFPEGNIVGIGSLRNQSINEVRVYKFNITCQLAHINITVKDEADKPLPFINIALMYNHTRLEGTPISEIEPFVTDYKGIWTIRNTLTNISYKIEARRYGYLFSTTLIENLSSSLSVNITCPTYTLFVHVLGSRGLPLQNVEVTVYEWSSGVTKPVQSETTNDRGSATFHITFGKYKVWVYNQDHTIVLNKTVVNLIKDRLFFVVHCKISNVDLSVVVKDYFGNPISNALVEVERENVDIPPQKAGSNGKTSFENIIGGEVRISVSVKGKLCETRTLYLDETRVVVFKLGRYVMVAGYPLETTQFIACISLGMLVALFALALIYRRFRTRKVSEEKEKSL